MKFIVAICLFGLAYAVDPVCRLTPETGPCRAYIPMYYYDSETGECQKFVYGGCDGNENKFFTEEECRRTCDVQESNVAICHLEPERGMCLAYMPRYYYNA
ncbi:BPTI/Kunitz-type proteinase inhibitor domain-containing protein, partial [Staphylococcus aureus]|uniref:BPTI/Kunitz-type proteinase inhibitor domain-containing protein n=1 Tax=Staphylococcus aureus TaxID=1280 RepID=UPI0038B3A466